MADTENDAIQDMEQQESTEPVEEINEQIENEGSESVQNDQIDAEESDTEVQTNADDSEPVLVKQVQLDSLIPDESMGTSGMKMDLLMNLALNVSIELGRTEMLIKDVLKLDIGSIVELNKLAGEPVELLINNKIFAEGEVVVIEDNFGVRITNLARTSEEMNALHEALITK